MQKVNCSRMFFRENLVVRDLDGPEGGVTAACFNNTTSYPLLVTSHITTKILGLGDVPEIWGRPQDVLGGLGRVGGRKFTK